VSRAKVLYVGGLPQEVDGPEQDAVSSDLFARFSCLPGAAPGRAQPSLVSGG